MSYVQCLSVPEAYQEGKDLCHPLPDREYHGDASSVGMAIISLGIVPNVLPRGVLIAVEGRDALFVKPSITLPGSALGDHPGSMLLLKVERFLLELGCLRQTSKDPAP